MPPGASPRKMWQVTHGARPMLAGFVTSAWPRAASPCASRASSYAMASGSGVFGMVCAGSLSFGNTYPSEGASGAVAAGAAAAPVMLAAASTGFFAPAAAVAPAGTGAGDPAAASFWCAAQLSNLSGDTTNARSRMLACDEPQYSVQNPLYTFSTSESL